MMTYLVIAAVILIPAIIKAMEQERRQQRVRREREAFFAANGITTLPGAKGLSRRDIVRLRKEGAVT